MSQSSSTPPTVVLGIDVSKKRLDAHLLPSGQIWQIPMETEALEAFAAALGAVDLVVMEASGGLQNLPAAVLAQAGLPVAIVNASQVRHFAKALGQRAKTDAIDAEMIARFGLQTAPAARALPDDEQALLSELVRRRAQLVQDRTRESNRLTTARFEHVRRDIEKHLAWLDQRIVDLDKQIDQRVKKSPMWRADEQLLRSVPGVGAVTARSLLAQLPELGRLDRHKIAALVGLAPYPRDSGQWRGKRHIVGGRAAVRCSLYMAALTATRCCDTFKTFYRRLLQNGKTIKQALTAVMRKLLTVCNAILRDQRPWGKLHTLNS